MIIKNIRFLILILLIYKVITMINLCGDSINDTNYDFDFDYDTSYIDFYNQLTDETKKRKESCNNIYRKNEFKKRMNNINKIFEFTINENENEIYFEDNKINSNFYFYDF